MFRAKLRPQLGGLLDNHIRHAQRVGQEIVNGEQLLREVKHFEGQLPSEPQGHQGGGKGKGKSPLMPPLTKGPTYARMAGSGSGQPRYAPSPAPQGLPQEAMVQIPASPLTFGQLQAAQGWTRPQGAPPRAPLAPHQRAFKPGGKKKTRRGTSAQKGRLWSSEVSEETHEALDDSNLMTDGELLTMSVPRQRKRTHVCPPCRATYREAPKCALCNRTLDNCACENRYPCPPPLHTSVPVETPKVDAPPEFPLSPGEFHSLLHPTPLSANLPSTIGTLCEFSSGLCTSMVVMLSIAGLSAKAFVDTGATHNFISCRFHDRVCQADPSGRTSTPKRENLTYRLGVGETLHKAPVVNLTFTIDKEKVERPFAVCPLNTYDVVLGMDFLVSFHASLEFPRNVLTFRHQGRKHELRGDSNFASKHGMDAFCSMQETAQILRSSRKARE
eukprot:scaffold440_cov340-Pavlova_lutheri.AAC.1